MRTYGDKDFCLVNKSITKDKTTKDGVEVKSSQIGDHLGLPDAVSLDVWVV